MTYEPSRSSVMDKLLMMKELYAAVDHLEENLRHTKDERQAELYKQMIQEMTQLRRETVGSLGGDKNFACLLKHMGGAWKAAEEVWLADYDSEAYQRYKRTEQLFYWVAESFLGEKLEQCARCDTEKDDTVSTGTLESIHPHNHN